MLLHLLRKIRELNDQVYVQEEIPMSLILFIYLVA